MPPADPLAWMQDDLAALDLESRRRRMRVGRPLPHGFIEIDGQRLLNLSGNDYLGLAGDLATPSTSTGATASRLVVGNHPSYAALEAEMAELKGTEGALVFGSGYLANLGAITAVAGRGDTVFSDRLNHASIVDGIVLSRANLKRYHHNDLDHLDLLLSEPASGRRLIVTDAVFSMDGDLADLAGLVDLKERHGAMLMIDEAHSGGVFGERGEGLAHQLGLGDRVDIQMGTFSKAYGCYGAYVAGRQVLIDYLTNHARALIYTTGLPPAVVEAIRQAVAKAATESWRRDHLWRLSALARERLTAAGLDIGPTASPIIPILVGDSARAVELSRRLQERGVALVAIRPPTVPTGTARLRLSLSAALREEDLRAALETIVETLLAHP